MFPKFSRGLFFKLFYDKFRPKLYTQNNHFWPKTFWRQNFLTAKFWVGYSKQAKKSVKIYESKIFYHLHSICYLQMHFRYLISLLPFTKKSDKEIFRHIYWKVNFTETRKNNFTKITNLLLHSARWSWRERD